MIRAGKVPDGMTVAEVSAYICPSISEKYIDLHVVGNRAFYSRIP